MLPNSEIGDAVKKMLVESKLGMVDMELVEYICTLRESGMSSDEFKECLTKLFVEYNKD